MLDAHKPALKSIKARVKSFGKRAVSTAAVALGDFTVGCPAYRRGHDGANGRNAHAKEREHPDDNDNGVRFGKRNHLTACGKGQVVGEGDAVTASEVHRREHRPIQ